MAKNTKDSALEWSKYLKEKVVILIWCDLCNGLTKSDIMQKLDEDMYEGIETSKLSRSMRYKVIADAYKMAKSELEEQREKQRELFYSRLTTVFNDSMQANDRQNALKALEMFAKFGDLYDNKQKVEVSGTLSQDITINFGIDE